MPSTTPPFVTEDDIDDLLYFARTGELHDLQTNLSALAKSANVSQLDLLSAAVDADSGNSLLHMASANGHNETLRFLLSLLPAPSQSPNPADSSTINAQNSSGNTPLHWASLNGHLEAVKVLVAAGADPALVNKASHDVVYEAEVNGEKEVVEWLLKECHGLEKVLGVNGGEGANGDEEDGEGEGEGEEEKESEVQELEAGVEKIQMAEKP